MKRRMFSGLMALCMLLTLLPVRALGVYGAEEAPPEDSRYASEGVGLYSDHEEGGGPSAAAVSAEPGADSAVLMDDTDGYCGSNIYWSLSNGVLYMSGDGDMYDYGYQSSPWYASKDSIEQVVIPYGVTRLGSYAFAYCYNLSYIEIPDSVTSIGGDVFSHCSSLTSLMLPESISSIESYAFWYCDGLETLIIPKSVVTMGDYAFSGCENITLYVYEGSYAESFAQNHSMSYVTIPDDAPLEDEPMAVAGSCGDNLVWELSGTGVLMLSGSGNMYDYDDPTGEDPWEEYAGMITAVELPEELTSIGAGAFSDCVLLTGIVIPENCVSIGAGAFSGCVSLEDVTIPQGVTEIGADAFSGCGVLALTVYEGSEGLAYAVREGLYYTVWAPEPIDQGTCGSNVNWALYEDGTLKLTGFGPMSSYSSYSSSAAPWYSSYRSQILSVEIGEGVESIGSYAFNGCANLASVSIPDSVASIEDYAFKDCSGLSAAVIPAGTASFGDYAFSGCSSLVLTVSAGSAARRYAIRKSIPYVTDGESRSVMKDGTCGSSLYWILFSGGTLEIEGSGVMNDYSYSGLHTTAPWSAYTESITAVKIADGVQSIGAYAFYGRKEYNDDYRFTNLAQVEIPESVTRIGGHAFENCVGLTSVNEAESLSTVDDYAFSACTALESLRLPNAAKSISTYAFYNDPQLTLEVYGGSQAEEYATVNGLKFKVVNDENPVSHSGKCGSSDISWLLYESGTLRFKGSGAMPGYSISSDNQSRSTAPWSEYNEDIKKVEFDEGITSVGSYAFFGEKKFAIHYGFPNLTTVSLPASMKTLGEGAFSGCAGLTSIVLPDKLGSIQGKAFANCTALTELTIPIALANIDFSAFSGCSNLTLLVYQDSYADFYAMRNNVKFRRIEGGRDIAASGACGEKLNWMLYSDGELGFTFIDDNGTMYDFSASSEEYHRTTAPWYEYRSRISRVVIPDGVTNIGSYAFYGQPYYGTDYQFTQLESVQIPASVTTVGENAFTGCISLTKAALPSTLTSLGSNAFNSCTALKELVIPRDLKSIGDNAFSGCDALVLSVYGDSYGRSYAVKNGIQHKVVGGSDDRLVIDSGSCGSGSGDTLNWILYSDGRLEFEGSGAMQDYTVESRHTTAPWYQYAGQIVSVEIPEGVTRIGSCAFYGVKFYDEDNRFGALRDITIPRSVESIGSGAFQNCVALTQTTVPPYVTSIEQNAFSDCSNITLLVQPGSTAREYAVTNGIRHMVSGTARVVTAGGSCGDSLKWLLYTDGTLEFEGSGAMWDYQENGYLTQAPWSSYRSQITSVVIPDGVTRIGDYAFYGSLYYSKDYRFSELTGIQMTDSVRVIGEYAFSGCIGLSRVTIPESVETLGGGVFSGCSGLYSLTIPAKVSSIGADAFVGCTRLDVRVHEDTEGCRYAKENQLTGMVIETGERFQPEAPEKQPDVIVPNPTSPFDVTSDAYSFVNTTSSFGYSGSLTGKDYPIRYDPTFQMIFGDSLAGKAAYKSTQREIWGGNCCGMSATIALMYAGVIPTVSGFGKDKAASLSINDRSSEMGIDVLTYIEAMQIAQKTDVFGRVYKANTLSSEQLSSGASLNRLVEAVSAAAAENKCTLIAVGKNKVGAHALLAYRVDRKSDSQCELYVYDSNLPGRECVITLTGSGGTYNRWSYTMAGSYGEWGTGIDTSCFISFIPFETLLEIWENRGSMYQTSELLSVNVSNLSIKDINGREVARLEDGELITDNSDIFVVPQLSLSWTTDNSIYLPKDFYTISTTDSQPLQATMTDRNLEASVETTANNVSFAVDDASRMNDVYFDDMTQEHTYSVELASAFKDSQYETLSISGSGADAAGSTVSISGAGDSLSLSSNLSYDSLYINGSLMNGQGNVYHTIEASASGGGSILPSGSVKTPAGASQSFTFLPDPGYRVAWIERDGGVREYVSSNTYNWASVNEDGHTIRVYFEKAYEIGNVTFDPGTRTALASDVLNAAASTLYGVLLDGDGRFVDTASVSVSANMTSASVTFAKAVPEQYQVRLFLMDSSSKKPLSSPVAVKS